MQCIAKLLWCIFMVLIIVDNWSDASIDNLMASKHSNKNIVQNINAAETSENCNRLCKFGVKPRRCIFKFDITAGVFEDGSPSLLVNQQSPGPSINVCLQDVVHVVVINSLPGQELSIHWHGMLQQGSPFMDGVPMITQCPTIAGTAYTYTFRASEVGTHFYHAHSANQQAAGVVGALVVRQPAPLEPSQELYSHDRGEEHELLVSAAGPASKPNVLRINGRDDFRMFVSKGFRYRIRMTNAVVSECLLYASVDRHPLAVIAADGYALKPTLTKKIAIFPGERVDFVLSAKQEASGYWMRIVGTGACQGLEARALIVYSGFNYTSLEPFDEQETVSLPPPVMDVDTNARLSQRDLVLTQTLHAFNSPHVDTILTQTVDKQVFLSVDRNTVDFKDSNIEFRYLNDAMPIPPFYPTQLTMTTKVTQINQKNFLYPSSPLLTQPNDVKPYIFCEVGVEAENKNPECLQTITAQLKSVLELVLVNEGFGGNDTYTFHLHGNPMYVLTSSDWSREEGISVEDFKTWDATGKIKRNLIDPPVKDTIAVPNKGFAVVRVYLDNPGTWLLECRSCALTSLPVAILIRTPIQIAEPLKGYLPKCGNYKGPDVLLN